MSDSAKKITPQEVWAGIDRLREAQKETDRQFKESRREADRRLKRLERTIDKTNAKFDNRWGKFVENLVHGDLVALLSSWEIKVHRVQPRMTYPPCKGKRGGEFDLVAVNGEELIIIEVKSTLEKGDVDRFIEKLKMAQDVFTEYRERKIYGGVAYLEAIKKADEYADSQGLFTIKAPGGNSNISTITNNRKTFRPVAFSAL